MDVHRDGMVYASIEHPPVLGGKIKTYDGLAHAFHFQRVRIVIGFYFGRPGPADASMDAYTMPSL